MGLTQRTKKEKITPIGIKLLVSFLFLSGFFWLAFWAGDKFFELLESLLFFIPFEHATSSQFLSFWSLLSFFTSFILGFAIINARRTIVPFALGFAIINAVLFLYWLNDAFWSDNGLVYVVGFCCYLAMGIILVANRNYFNLIVVAVQTNDTSDSIFKASPSLQYSGEFNNQVLQLRKLITKKTLLTPSKKSKVTAFIKTMSVSKQEALQLIAAYDQHFNASLIDDLKNMSNSYAVIQDILEPFISHGIVEGSYPHKRLV